MPTTPDNRTSRRRRPHSPGPDERTLTTVATIPTSAESPYGYLPATAGTAVPL